MTSSKDSSSPRPSSRGKLPLKQHPIGPLSPLDHVPSMPFSKSHKDQNDDGRVPGPYIVDDKNLSGDSDESSHYRDYNPVRSLNHQRWNLAPILRPHQPSGRVLQCDDCSPSAEPGMSTLLDHRTRQFIVGDLSRQSSRRLAPIGKRSPIVESTTTTTTAAAVPNLRANADGEDLTSTLLKRISKLETDLRVARDEMRSKDTTIKKLMGQLEKSETTSQNQISKFLLLICGLADVLEQHGISQHPLQDDIERIVAQHGGVDPEKFAKDKRHSPSESLEGEFNERDGRDDAVQQQQQAQSLKEERKVDIDYIRKRIDELNSLVESDRVIQQHSNQSNIHQFSKMDDVTLVFYSNGMVVDGGPFRPYSWSLTKSFLRDIFDGYFPYEFKHKYPNGVWINVVDQTGEEFTKDVEKLKDAVREKVDPSGSSSLSRLSLASSKVANARIKDIHMLAMEQQQQQQQQQQQGGKQHVTISKQTFLKQLPQSSIVNGRIVSVRNEVANLLNRGSAGDSETWASCVHEIQCSLSTGVGSGPAGNPCTVAQLRVRVPQHCSLPTRRTGASNITLLFSVHAHETIGYVHQSVEAKLLERVFGPENDVPRFELRSFPAVRYTDLQQTLAAAGLSPRATLFCHFVDEQEVQEK